jgi:adenine-specific DNA-methyltransferase
VTGVNHVTKSAPVAGSGPRLRSVPERAWNTFLEGDNLDVLATLDAGSVDLVYADPPYNTGNDFAYADSFRDTSHADAATGRHAAWTAMMRPRLHAVRRVLAPHGAVFVSIDDNEAAHLRLLLDEVFGEANFLAQVVVSLNPKGRQLGRGFATSHEYVLVYARDAKACVLDASTSETVDADDFPHTTPDGRRFRHLPLRNTNKKFNPVTAPTLHYSLHGDPASGRAATTATPRDGRRRRRAAPRRCRRTARSPPGRTTGRRRASSAVSAPSPG